MSCYLCGCDKCEKRKGKVRDNSSLDILECSHCGLVYLSDFSHIEKEFYENSGMHECDTDINDWLKETREDDVRRYRFIKSIIDDKSVLDFGCGNGGFLLQAQGTTSTIEGVEIEKRLEEHFLRNNLKVYPSVTTVNRCFDVITMFHVIEHILDPVPELIKLSEKLNEGGQIIIETPNANDALLSLYQSDAFSECTYWSCHLYLYNQDTLAQLAKKSGLRVNYIKQTQRYSLANHLYWLANGKPGGHLKWNFMDSHELHSEYEKQLAGIGCCDTLWASFSKLK